MEISSERRYHSKIHTALKKKLDALHYSYPLSLDSAPLVDKLLVDLLKTTEGFQKLKKQNIEISSKLQAAEANTGPLQRETSRLLQQNNQLHVELMTVKEQVDARENQWRASVKVLEGENADLKFLIEQTKEGVKRLEGENLMLREKLDAALSKTYLPGTELGRTQSFELTQPLNRADPQGQAFSRANSDWANDLRQADERAQTLQEELSRALSGREDLQKQIRELKSSLKSRDDEIRRISSAPSEVNMDRLTLQYRDDNYIAEIKALNQRVDFLNNENVRLESELTEANRIIKKSEGALNENQSLLTRVGKLREQNEVLGKRVEELQALGRSINFVPPDEYKKLQSQNEHLYNTVQELKEELAEGRRRDEQLQKVNSEINYQKQAFSEAMEKVQRDKRMLEDDLKGYQARALRSEEELHSTNEQLNLYRTQSQNYKRQLEQAQEQIQKAHEDNLSSTEEYYSLRQRLTSLESQKQQNETEIANLQFEIERISKLRIAAEQHLEMIKSEALKARSQLDNSSAANTRVSMILDSTNKELETIKEENRQMGKLRQEDKRAYLELEQRFKSVFSELQSYKDSIGRGEQEYKTLQDQLSDKLAELRSAESLRIALEQELAELRPLRGRWEASQSEVQKIREEVIGYHQESAKLKRESEFLKDQMRLRDAQLTDLDNLLKQAQEEKRVILSQLTEIDEAQYSAETAGKKSEILQAELEAIRQRLQESNDNERRLVQQVEALKVEIGKERDRVQQGGQQYQRVQKQHGEIQQEVEEYRAKVHEVEKQLAKVKSENLQLEQQSIQLNLQIDELKRSVGLEQSQKFRLEDGLQSMQKQLELEGNKNAQLSEKNTYLTTLIDNLEKVKDELFNKLRSIQTEKSTTDGQQTQLYQEVASLRQQLADEVQTNRELQEALQNLDSERDYVQALLDQKTEELAAVQAAVLGYQRELQSLKEDMGSSQEQEASLGRRISEKDSQIQRLTEKCESLKQQLDDALGKLKKSSRDLLELQESVRGLTRENQIINEHLIQVTAERDRIHQSQDEVSKAERLAQQLLRNGEREKEDLRLTYSKACEENERLSSTLGSLSEEHKQLANKLFAAEQEILNCQNYISQQEVAISNYLQEISTLERQVTTLTSQIEQAEYRARDALSQKDLVLKDFNAARQLSMGLEHSREDTNRHLNSLNHELAMMESKYREAQTENTGLRAQLEYEQQRYQDLEYVLIRERENMAQLHTEITKVEELNRSFGGKDDADRYQKKIEEQRTEILNLEMECMRLRDDFGKTRHMLNKSDSKVKELEKELNRTRNLSGSFHSSPDK